MDGRRSASEIGISDHNKNVDVIVQVVIELWNVIMTVLRARSISKRVIR